MTICVPGVRLGLQRPPILTVPPSLSTEAGREAADLAASAGLVLDPWQVFLLEQSLGERVLGKKWAAFEVGVLVSRQNGKGALLEARELAGLFLFGERLILHTAHEFPTAAEAFRRIRLLIQSTPDLDRLVAKMPEAHGNEGVELRSGQRLQFKARTESAGLGFSGDTLILDEAQKLPDPVVDVLVPTMGARPNPQVIYTGTVPKMRDASDHWAALRARGRAGTSASLMWAEWAPPEPGEGATLADYDLDDLAVWAAANPSLGVARRDGSGKTVESVQRERDALTSEGFAREILAIWPSGSTGEALIDGGVWQSLAVVPPPPSSASTVCFAVDVSPERWASIGLAEDMGDGTVLLEVADHRKGTDWVAARCVELRDRWSPLGFVLDPAMAGFLIPALAEVGIVPALMQASDLKSACAGWFDAVTGIPPTVRHRGEPELDAAVAGAKKRKLTDAWALSRVNSDVDISPLVAVVLARWGLLTLEAPKLPPAKPVGGAESQPDNNILTMGF